MVTQLWRNTSHTSTTTSGRQPFVILLRIGWRGATRHYSQYLDVWCVTSRVSSSFSSNTYLSLSSLFRLQQRNGEDIPLVMRTSIEYILECCMSTVGIFRRTPSQNTLQDIKKKFNLGKWEPLLLMFSGIFLSFTLRWRCQFPWVCRPPFGCCNTETIPKRVAWTIVDVWGTRHDLLY